MLCALLPSLALQKLARDPLDYEEPDIEASFEAMEEKIARQNLSQSYQHLTSGLVFVIILLRDVQ